MRMNGPSIECRKGAFKPTWARVKPSRRSEAHLRIRGNICRKTVETGLGETKGKPPGARSDIDQVSVTRRAQNLQQFAEALRFLLPSRSPDERKLENLLRTRGPFRLLPRGSIDLGIAKQELLLGSNEHGQALQSGKEPILGHTPNGLALRREIRVAHRAGPDGMIHSAHPDRLFCTLSKKCEIAHRKSQHAG